MDTFLLPNLRSIPALGLGTWELRGARCASAVKAALSLGYRHIDTAEFYGNEEEIGEVLSRSGIPRDELFITTKVWTNHFHAPQFKRATEDSLRRLKLDHLDLLLIHWPSDSVPMAETVGALCRMEKEGKTLSAGVSNFSAAQWEEASSLASAPVSVNQVKFHLFERPKGLLDHAKNAKLHITAYSPLGRGDLLLHPSLSEVGHKHGKTPAQVALRWLLQQGVSVIPKASGEEHLRENMDIFDFQLDRQDLELLERAGG